MVALSRLVEGDHEYVITGSRVTLVASVVPLHTDVPGLIVTVGGVKEIPLNAEEVFVIPVPDITLVEVLVALYRTHGNEPGYFPNEIFASVPTTSASVYTASTLYTGLVIPLVLRFQ